jgi:hypothetical protein
MSEFFSKLSSKLSNLLSPRAENWFGWCKDVANFLEESVVFYKSRQEEGSIFSDQISIWVDMIKFQKDAVSNYGNESRNCKTMMDWLIRCREALDDVHMNCMDLYEKRAGLCEAFISWYRAATRGDINLIRKRVLTADWNALCVRYKVELVPKMETFETIRRELCFLFREFDIAQNKLIRFDKLNVRGLFYMNEQLNFFTEAETRQNEIKARWRKISARSKQFQDRRLQLLNHPDVVRRRELIRVLQNIWKVLAKRSNENILFFEKENAIVIPGKFIYAIKLALNWLESSIFKELGALRIKVIMTETGK